MRLLCIYMILVCILTYLCCRCAVSLSGGPVSEPFLFSRCVGVSPLGTPFMEVVVFPVVVHACGASETSDKQTQSWIRFNMSNSLNQRCHGVVEVCALWCMPAALQTPVKKAGSWMFEACPISLLSHRLVYSPLLYKFSHYKQ